MSATAEVPDPVDPDPDAADPDTAGPDPSEPDTTSEPDTSEPDTPGSDRVDERAHLLPEELAAGSDDPQKQAEVILAESDERTADPQGTQDASSQVP